MSKSKEFTFDYECFEFVKDGAISVKASTLEEAIAKANARLEKKEKGFDHIELGNVAIKG